MLVIEPVFDISEDTRRFSNAAFTQENDFEVLSSYSCHFVLNLVKTPLA